SGVTQQVGDEEDDDDEPHEDQQGVEESTKQIAGDDATLLLRSRQMGVPASRNRGRYGCEMTRVAR
ncbi:MAG TPA: hypothetical protein VD789_07250, partial [Thermomicrobiales bacterium]|nr:hypothetical protein [Thermomicrobiales bacterium]